MPANNTMIMMGLAMAGLWFMNRQRGSQEDQVDQLTGASMMAAGVGTAPNASFMPWSMPSDPVFFFNSSGEMAQTPYSKVPAEARSGEDIGQHITGKKTPELEFKVAENNAAVGTSDKSPTTAQFAGGVVKESDLVPSTLWDDPIAIAEANKMPMLAIQDTGSWEIGTGGIKILGANVNIATLSSKEGFRAVKVEPGGGPGFAFTTDADALAQYVEGFTGTPYNPQWFNQPARQRASDPSANDEDRGLYPTTSTTTFGSLYQPGELEFEVALTGVPPGTSDTSPATPEFASSFTFGDFMYSSSEEMDFVDFTPSAPIQATATGAAAISSGYWTPSPTGLIADVWEFEG